MSLYVGTQITSLHLGKLMVSLYVGTQITSLHVGKWIRSLYVGTDYESISGQMDGESVW
jgi:tyrosyl-tRNA synthetase